MKRLISASLCAGFFVCAQAAVAQTPTRAHLKEYTKLYQKAASRFGKRAPGRNISKWGMSSGRPASDQDIVKSVVVLRRMFAPPPVIVNTPTTTSYSTPSSSTSYSYSGSNSDYASVPGVPSSFAACVAMRESTNGAGSSNIYGILGSGGQGSVAEQKAAFSRMYAQRGTQPWAPYDGC